MKSQRCLVVLCIALLAFGAVCRGQCALGWNGMVATVHPLATGAGVEALKRGGNAVDAAVAAALMLGVVNGHGSGIGGGCFFVIHLADGKLIAIDGREIAGARATRDMYLRNGKPHHELSKVGPLASGVPGMLAACDYAVRRYGQLRLRDLLLPAADVAHRGFPIDRVLADRLKHTSKTLARFVGSRAVLLKPDGSPYRQGELLKQPDLAETYRAIANHGTVWFYKGPFANAVGEWMARHGGILTAEDFAGYRARQRKPVMSTYRDYTIVGFPPPSSGGVHVAQILNILEHFDLKALYQDDPVQMYHVIAEAMKLAFADRVHWLGDPDFVNVPRGLTGKQYAAQLAKRIDLKKATIVPKHGQPPQWQRDHFGRHTTHVSTAGREGNWVALTATINTAFGSKIIVPGTGVILNNEMDDFSIALGVPNVDGLIGAEANAIAAGKRPLSSMSPTIVLKNGKPIMTVGAAGGPTIITQVVMTIVYHLDLGMNLSNAVAAPRVHHQWMPDLLRVESSLNQATTAALESRGHRVDCTRGFGATQAISVLPDGKKLIGVYDPRVPGKAAGAQLPCPRGCF